jgi:hypothetical protein
MGDDFADVRVLEEDVLYFRENISAEMGNTKYCYLFTELLVITFYRTMISMDV